MTIELLDAELIDRTLAEQGRSRKWVLEQIDLGKKGYELLRGEWMPKDPGEKTRVISELSKLLGVDKRQLVLRLEPKTA